MFKAIKDKFFQRQPHEDELVKLREIAERAKRFEQSVLESMNASFNDSDSDSSSSESNSKSNSA